jgi:hypothetical protein
LKADDVPPLKTLANAGGHIHRYAQIAAVADAYITAISPRPGWAEPVHALEAMKMLISEAGKAFNTHVVNALIGLIPVFPAGTRIIIVKSPKPLLIGYLGIVTKANIEEKEKPQVLLVMDKFRRRIKPIQLDLAAEKGIEIQFAPL